ncbi:MAG: hypothetical protein AB2531_04135, partial [Candidatus Thiodiazotropha sp.]
MKPVRIIFGLLGGVILLSAAYLGLGEPPREVETIAVERGDLELVIRVTGEVINDRQVALTALVDGQVKRVETALGARVRAGEVVAAMDNRAAEANRQRAKAYLQQQDVHRREELMRYRRLQKLAAKGAVSTEKLEEAKLNWEAASAAWEVAKADLSLTDVAREWRSSVSWIGPSVEREKDKRLNTFRVRLGLGEAPPPLLLGQQVDL